MDKKKITNMEVKKKTEMTFSDIYAGMERSQIRISLML